jgi:hypothetical protein
VFVTKCRRPIVTDAMLTYCEHTMHAVCAELDVELVEFNGEADHVTCWSQKCAVSRIGVATECAHASTDLFLPTVDQILPMELSGDLGGFNCHCSGSKPKKKTKRRHTQ